MVCDGQDTDRYQSNKRVRQVHCAFIHDLKYRISEQARDDRHQVGVLLLFHNC